MREYLSVLLRCPLFDRIAPDELDELLTCLDARTKRCLKGETIMREGMPAGDLGVVLSGAVQIAREDCAGNRSITAHLVPGELFAEAFACAGAMPLPVQVTAVEDTQVLLIGIQRLIHSDWQACPFHHQLIFNLMKILAMKNLHCQQKLAILTRRSTRDKLMTYLRMQARQAGSPHFTIPYHRQELADYLAVDRSGLSAEISKLQREGVLSCHRNHFTLFLME